MFGVSNFPYFSIWDHNFHLFIRDDDVQFYNLWFWFHQHLPNRLIDIASRLQCRSELWRIGHSTHPVRYGIVWLARGKETLLLRCILFRNLRTLEDLRYEIHQYGPIANWLSNYLHHWWHSISYLTTQKVLLYKNTYMKRKI